MHKFAFIALALAIVVSPASAQAPMPPPATGASADAHLSAKAEAPKKDDTGKKTEAEAAKKAEDAKAAADQHNRNTIAVVGFLLFSALVATFCLWSEVLRDKDPIDFPGVPSAVPPLAPLKIQRTYSLSQSQMVWWFWIVTGSFIYLFLKNFTGDLSHFDTLGGLQDSGLILMGVGAGTAFGAAIIEQSRKDKGQALTDYNNAVCQLTDPACQAVLFANPMQVIHESAEKLKSDGFFADVLSDANGVSLHRFQSFAWTAILGVLFLVGVFGSGKSMPTLSPQELTLLGISAGTYLGLKIPEAKT